MLPLPAAILIVLSPCAALFSRPVWGQVQVLLMGAGVPGCGLQWLALRLLVPLPWSRRPWARPFLTVLAPSQRAAAGQGPTTTIDWTMHMVKVVSRGRRGQPWLVLGDGSSACVRLAW